MLLKRYNIKRNSYDKELLNTRAKTKHKSWVYILSVGKNIDKIRDGGVNFNTGVILTRIWVVVLDCSWLFHEVKMWDKK